MIKVNCASIPGELYESEFFGRASGTFTGAVKERAGRFQAAHGGTLFLDEVGELPISLQSKLLRVLQEGTYERTGEDKTRHVDVRIIAATNRNIKEAIDEGTFRQDLYYRLNVFPIDVAPLKNRKGDIGLLAYHFLKKISSDMKIPVPELTAVNLKKLTSYNWPGNVRELRNVIERSVIITKGGRLYFNLTNTSQQNKDLQPDYTDSTEAHDIMTDNQIRKLIQTNIVHALQRCHGKIYGKNGAAVLLGVAPTTLTSRIKKYSIDTNKLKS